MILRSLACMTLLIAAACYRPGEVESCSIDCSSFGCPSNMFCNETTMRCATTPGGCTLDEIRDADVPDADDADAPDDGPPGDVLIPLSCPGPTSAFNDQPLAAGEWMVANRALPRALKRANGEIVYSDGPVDDPSSSYTKALSEGATERFDAPRMSPNGMELYLNVYRDLVLTFARSTRSGGGWTTVEPVALKQGGVILIPSSGALSPPTTTNPRRFIRSELGSYEEYIETSPVLWTMIGPPVTPQFGPFFLGDASLSENGLRMVFTGQITGQFVKVFYTKRASLSSAWGPAVQLPNLTSVSASQPYLTSDCQHLYYTGSDGLIHHVSY